MIISKNRCDFMLRKLIFRAVHTKAVDGL